MRIRIADERGFSPVGLLLVAAAALVVFGGDALMSGDVEGPAVLGVRGGDGSENGGCLGLEDAPLVEDGCTLITVYGNGKDRDCILEYELECDGGSPDHVGPPDHAGPPEAVGGSSREESGAGGGGDRSVREDRAASAASRALEHREIRRGNLSDDSSDRVWGVLDRFFVQLETRIDRLEQLTERIDSRLRNFKKLRKNTDLSGADEHLERAGELLEYARDTLEQAWLTVDSLDGTEGVEISAVLEDTEGLVLAVQNITREARSELLKAIQEVRTSMSVATPE